MSGAAAEPDRPDDAADRQADGEDAPDGVAVEPPLDNRITQPMPRIERAATDASSPSSRLSASPDTVRVDAPAWFLHAQKRAAESNRASEPNGAADEERVPEQPDDDAEDHIEADLGDATPDDAAVGDAGHEHVADGRPQFLDPTVAASYREPKPAPDLVAGSIGLLGAGMLSIGSTLTWARSTGVVEASVTGLSGSNGWGTLACGAVVALGAALVLTGRRGTIVGGSMLIAALAAVYFCGFSAVDILRTGDELPEILVDTGVDRGTAEVATLELTGGFAVVSAGAVAALVAGTVAFARRV